MPKSQQTLSTKVDEVKIPTSDLSAIFSFVCICICLLNAGVTRAILTQAGVNMPDGLVVTKEENDWDYNGAFPAVVKPTKMENSVGVELVRTKEEMEAAIERAWAFGDALIIDAFVPGREVGCIFELFFSF